MKYIVLGHMRSGSSLINESLEMHPDLKVAYEIFHPSASVENTKITNIKSILQELYGFKEWPKTDTVFSCRWGRYPDEEIFPTYGKYNIGAYKIIQECVPLNKLLDRVFEQYDGFKILYNQLRRNYKIWNYLVGMKDLKIIHIFRDNYLESLTSLYVAHVSGNWQKKDFSNNLDEKFYINPLTVEEYFYSMDFEIEHYTSMFKKNSLIVKYDDLFNWEDTVLKIEDFLEIKKAVLNKKYLKRNLTKPSNIIKNYEELKDFFKNTKWEVYFNNFHFNNRRFFL